MRLLLLVASVAALGGCLWPEPRQRRPPQPLPQIAIYEIVPRSDSAGVDVRLAPGRDPLRAAPADRRVTITTRDADAKTLILWLAQQGGMQMVVADDVRARVSVSFRDIPVADALRAVMAEAGLSFLVSPGMRPWPPVVFFQLPVNINEASAEAIAQRFNVSLEMARWIVETRPPR